jgi:hypothetical protein
MNGGSGWSRTRVRSTPLNHVTSTRSVRPFRARIMCRWKSCSRVIFSKITLRFHRSHLWCEEILHHGPKGGGRSGRRSETYSNKILKNSEILSKLVSMASWRSYRGRFSPSLGRLPPHHPKCLPNHASISSMIFG